MYLPQASELCSTPAKHVLHVSPHRDSVSLDNLVSLCTWSLTHMNTHQQHFYSSSRSLLGFLTHHSLLLTPLSSAKHALPPGWVGRRFRSNYDAINRALEHIMKGGVFCSEGCAFTLKSLRVRFCSVYDDRRVLRLAFSYFFLSSLKPLLIAHCFA